MGTIRFLVSRALIEKVLGLPGTCTIKEINPTVFDEYEFVVEDTRLPEMPEIPLVSPTIHEIIWEWNLSDTQNEKEYVNHLLSEKADFDAEIMGELPEE